MDEKISQLINLITDRIRHNTCAFRKLTGYYCPGCGGMRSLRFLLKGDLIHCLIYHPAVLYIIFILILLTVQLCLNRLRPQNKIFLLRPMHGYILIGLILIQWLVKNLLLYSGIDILNVHINQI